MMRSEHGDLLTAIRTSKDISDDSKKRLNEVIGGFAKSFA